MHNQSYHTKQIKNTNRAGELFIHTLERQLAQLYSLVNYLLSLKSQILTHRSSLPCANKLPVSSLIYFIHVTILRGVLISALFRAREQQ
jgi:hypothetical protein